MYRRMIGRFGAGVADMLTGSYAGSSQDQFDAVVLLAHNAGFPALGGSTLLKLHKRGDFAGKALEFPKWNKATNPRKKVKETNPGLLNRRRREAALYQAETGPPPKSNRILVLLRLNRYSTQVSPDKGFRGYWYRGHGMPGIIVALAGSKGGAGRTNCVLNLAVMAFQAGERPLVIDLDPQASVTKWGRVRSRLGLDGVEVVASNTELLADLIAANRGRTIIIDTPPHHSSITEDAMRAADVAVVPLHQDLVDLATLPSTAKMVRGCNRPTVVVLNDMSSAAKVSDDVLGKCRELGMPVSVVGDKPVLIRNRVAIPQAYAAGRGVHELGSTAAQAKHEFSRLYKAVLAAAPSRSAH